MASAPVIASEEDEENFEKSVAFMRWVYFFQVWTDNDQKSWGTPKALLWYPNLYPTYCANDCWAKLPWLDHPSQKLTRFSLGRQFKKLTLLLIRNILMYNLDLLIGSLFAFSLLLIMFFSLKMLFFFPYIHPKNIPIKMIIFPLNLHCCWTKQTKEDF